MVQPETTIIPQGDRDNLESVVLMKVSQQSRSTISRQISILAVGEAEGILRRVNWI